MPEPLVIMCPHCSALLTIEDAGEIARDGKALVTVSIPPHADPEEREPIYTSHGMPITARFRTRCAASAGEADVYI